MTNLEQWEKRLGLFYTPSLRIIAEIPISIDDVEEMGTAVKSLIKSKGMTTSTNTMVKRYPLTMLTLMASYAAYNTQQNYWQSFADFLDVERNQLDNQGWRHHFVKLAKRRNLKVFDFEDSNTPYVMSIRFQGGIPTYSLPDFFERMVLPSVERPALNEISTEKVLAYLMDRVLFVDSPVLNFLRNSGELGIEFFEESRKLVRHALKNHGEILPYEQVDLPVYVVNAFESYWERREDEQQHWRKPEIAISPYEEVPFFLLLPEQEIKLENITKTIWWEIQYSNHSQITTKACKVFHQGPLLVTNKDFQAIDQPVNEIIVSIHAQEKESGDHSELRRWKLNLLPKVDNTQIIAFSDNGKIVSNPISLPAEALFLVHPEQLRLDFDGPAHQIEEQISLRGNWKDWVIEFWNLSNAWSLRLMDEEKQVGNAISILGKLELPELFGGHKFQYQDYPDQPLYTSDLPSLKIPLRKILGSRPNLFAWQIRIRSLWDANPSLDQSFKLGKYESSIKFENQWAYFPLSILLGKESAGIYQVDINGPRDIHETFRLRIWPKLLVIGLDSEIKQLKADEKPFEFVLRLPHNAGCNVQAGMEHVTVEKKFGGFYVSALPVMNRVKLELTLPSDNGGLIRIPVSFPLPFPMWGLATDFNQGAVDLNTTLEHKSLDFMRQNSNAALHVEMYGLAEKIERLSLQLFDQNEKEILLQEVKFTRTEFTKDWLRAGLAPFSDSVRSIQGSGVFKLVYYPVDRSKAAVYVSLLVLNRELEIKEVGLEQVDDTTWKITWREKHPLKNRRVMLRPAWQPWQKPWEYKIPDNARGEFLLKEVGLPATCYHLYFYVRPSWEAVLDAPPENLQPFEINFCTAEDRITALEDCGSNANECFRKLMEKAVIYDSLGDAQKTGEMVTQAATYLLNLSSLELLLGSLEWIENSKNILPPFKSFFRKKMYHSQVVSNVLSKYDAKCPIIREYLQNTNRVKSNLPTDSAKMLLEKVDDPVAIKICLNTLVDKKEDDLIPIVVQLMRSGKLSKRDAVDLLSENPLAALEKLDHFNPGPYVDSVIARLIIYLRKWEEYEDKQRLINWMLRAIPYEESPDIILSYIHFIFNSQYEDRYRLIIETYQSGKISAQDAKELMSQKPFEAYQALQECDNNFCNEWAKEIYEQFPEAFGIFQVGSLIRTPIGEGQVLKIEKTKIGKVEKASISDQDLLITLKLEIDKEKFFIHIDFNENEISFLGYKEVRKCRYCNFAHPSQDKVLTHSREKHGIRVVDIVNFPLYLEKDKIKLIENIKNRS